jgi:hypothetical protein
MTEREGRNIVWETSAVPLRSRDVVTREEPGGVLLFQVRSDEMFFISRNAYALFELFDGARTIGDLADLLTEDANLGDRSEALGFLQGFAQELASRQLIEIWS